MLTRVANPCSAGTHNMKLHCRAVQLNGVLLEVHAARIIVEHVARKTAQQARLADVAVANQHQLEDVVAERWWGGRRRVIICVCGGGTPRCRPCAAAIGATSPHAPHGARDVGNRRHLIPPTRRHATPRHTHTIATLPSIPLHSTVVPLSPSLPSLPSLASHPTSPPSHVILLAARKNGSKQTPPQQRCASVARMVISHTHSTYSSAMVVVSACARRGGCVTCVYSSCGQRVPGGQRVLSKWVVVNAGVVNAVKVARTQKYTRGSEVARIIVLYAFAF